MSLCRSRLLLIFFFQTKCQLLLSDDLHSEPFKKIYEQFREHYIELMAHMNLLRQNDGLDGVRR